MFSIVPTGEGGYFQVIWEGFEFVDVGKEEKRKRKEKREEKRKREK